LRVWPGASPSLRKVMIAHCATPRSCTLIPGWLRELPPQQRSESFDPGCDRVDADPHRVTGGDAEADLAGDGPLPGFEPARVVADDVGAGGGSGAASRWMRGGSSIPMVSRRR
jgi:hypothetical protein